MRIVWNGSLNEFQAEITLTIEGWRDDIELLKRAGFRTSGPPEWIWTATKAAALNKLRDQKPKTGLTITELALEKYNFLNTQEQNKIAVKKKFKQLQKQIDSTDWKEFVDEETGIICKNIPPEEKKFVLDYVPPKPPEQYCFVCGEPVYQFEYPDLCLWCSKDNHDSN